MVSKEFYSDQEAGNCEGSTLPQDSYEEAEEDEALSLCDLPIYSDSSSSAQWDDFSEEGHQNSAPSNNNRNDDDEDDDDFFEFFSEDFSTSSSSTSATAENIIFCGKLIPFKDPPHVPNQKSQNLASSNTKRILRPTNSFDKAKPTSKAAKSSSKGSIEKGQQGKVSLMRSNTKSRWYLYMFGVSRLSLSTEMELSDIKSRQSRRGPAPTMFPAPEHDEEVVKSEEMRSIKVKGLWRMLRSLGLGCMSSTIANDVVKAAFV